MKRRFVTTIMFVLFVCNLFATDYVKGNLIIRTSEPLLKAEGRSELITNKTWFNEMLSTYRIHGLSMEV